MGFKQNRYEHSFQAAFWWPAFFLLLLFSMSLAFILTYPRDLGSCPCPPNVNSPYLIFCRLQYLKAIDYCIKWVEAKALRDNMAVSTTKFLYECIWCRFDFPLEFISDEGTHFLNNIIQGLTHHYVVVHKKSTPY